MAADDLDSCVPGCLDIHHWMELKYECPCTDGLCVKYEIPGTAGLYYRDHELLLVVTEP